MTRPTILYSEYLYSIRASASITGMTEPYFSSRARGAEVFAPRQVASRHLFFSSVLAVNILAGFTRRRKARGRALFHRILIEI